MPVSGRELAEPIEFLDLEHGDSIQLKITGYEMGVTTIHPKEVTARHRRIYMQQNDLADPPAADMPISIKIPVLRVTGTRLDKPSPLTYWDISSKRLQADLLPRLTNNGQNPLTVTLTAAGYKPTKVFSVEQGAA